MWPSSIIVYVQDGGGPPIIIIIIIIITYTMMVSVVIWLRNCFKLLQGQISLRGFTCVGWFLEGGRNPGFGASSSEEIEPPHVTVLTGKL